jgi:hypothetical protein
MFQLHAEISLIILFSFLSCAGSIKVWVHSFNPILIICKFASAPNHSKTIYRPLGLLWNVLGVHNIICVYLFLVSNLMCLYYIAIWLWLVFFLSLTMVFCPSRIKSCYLVMLQSSDYELSQCTLNCLDRYRLDPRAVNKFINPVCHFFYVCHKLHDLTI